MDRPSEDRELGAEREFAEWQAQSWGVELAAPFDFSNVSCVAPTKDGAVLKVGCLSDDEGLHEADALELWDGDGAVRLLRRSTRALLMERAVPGTDISGLPNELATEIAIDVATRLWRPATLPFRSVGPEVNRWLDEAKDHGSELAPLALELFAEVGGGAEWVVHGDLHHHNILLSKGSYVAIDPKPYLADREYDVPPFLWNPMNNDFQDEVETERRIKAFVNIGLDEHRIRAWTVIRGAYLRPDPAYVQGLKALIA